MKVKIEFEVDAGFGEVTECIYERVERLYYNLLDIDPNFKDISIEIRTHHNKIAKDALLINFNKKLPEELVLEVSQLIKPVDIYGEFCSMFHNGTCWGTREREKCTCGGLKKFCTYYPKRGENE